MVKKLEDVDNLCMYCPLPDELKGVQGTPNGYSSCEGSSCREAYDTYLTECEEDIE
jgi:hypothetical protein